MIDSALPWLLALLYPATLFFAFRQHSIWRVLLFVMALILFYLGWIQNYGLILILLIIAFSVTLPSLSETRQRAMQVMIVVLALLLGFHIIPGFSYLAIYEQIQLSELSTLYTVGISMDKAFAAIMLLGFGIAFTKQTLPNIKLIGLYTTGVIVTVLLFALPVGYLALDIKFHQTIWIWAFINLLITCVAEEAFFRGIIQHHLMQRLTALTQYAVPVAVLITALLFGLAHFAGGIQYIIIATIAGIGYGMIYAKTRNLIDSILVHFFANLAHFIFFTYPKAL